MATPIEYSLLHLFAVINNIYPDPLQSDLTDPGHDVCASAVRDEHQGVRLGNALDVADVFLHGFDAHLTQARPAAPCPCPEGHIAHQRAGVARELHAR